MINDIRDAFIDKKDDLAAKKIAGELLAKSTNLDMKELPENHKSEILRCLKKTRTKIERIISH